MFVSPMDSTSSHDKRAWANYVIYDSDTDCFYALFGTGSPGPANPTGYAIALDIAKSVDGVHWEFIAREKLPIAGAHAGFGIHKIGGWFYYYPTCSNPEKGVHFKVYRTRDFFEWEHLGDEYDVAPDRSLYHERWDELHIISDRDEAGRDVYYGYISSETREDLGQPGVGMVKSYDGISWTVLPPAVISWGELPSQHMELNFVEKIEGTYFLSMSGRMYCDSFGYSLFTFRGESPLGPFKPDAEKFRLSGNSRRDITWLGHSIPTPDGLLCALWLSHDKNPDIPSRSFAIGPLKRILYEEGHIRLGYWEGCEASKGDEITLDPSRIYMAHPTDTVRTERDDLSVSGGEVEISASRDGVIAFLPVTLSKDKGFVIEGKITLCDNRGHIATHQHAASAGFYFEETEGSGTAMLSGTLGVTRSGVLRYSDRRITDDNPYMYAGYGLAEGRGGALQGTLEFLCDDTVTPFGCASACALLHGREYSFRLFARGDYFELYLDGYYVQTYLLPQSMTGEAGLCCTDGRAVFRDVRCYSMNIDKT